MEVVMHMCRKSLDEGGMTIWPSKPITSSEVPNHPGLIQWLALADAKQCDSMVQSCLSHLNNLGTSSDDIFREALTLPYLGRLLDGLRSETKSALVRKIVWLPTDFKVLYILSTPC